LVRVSREKHDLVRVDRDDLLERQEKRIKRPIANADR
jgi:hypothetical protein